MKEKENNQEKEQEQMEIEQEHKNKVHEEKEEFKEKENHYEELEEEVKEKSQKISELEEEISILSNEKDEYINRLQRLQAEYSNYRKRSEKEKGQIQSSVTVEVIRELLPIIDNFERALSQQEADNDFCKGVEMIYRQIINFLKNQGIEEIEAVGEEFDHNLHNAVAQVESDEEQSGTVLEEVQKGYILADKVIRPAMVKVAQ